MSNSLQLTTVLSCFLGLFWVLSVIDKLDLRVPGNSVVGLPFTDEFTALYSHLQTVERPPIRSGRHYERVVDLRQYDYDCILHLFNRHSKEPRHKLELIDTGKHPGGEILRTVQAIFATNPRKLEVMRLDLAVDIPDITVADFNRRLRVKYKRMSQSFGVVRVRHIGRTKLETTYYGQRPNLIRVYDKTAERLAQFKTLLKQVSPDQEPPCFKEMFGTAEDAVLTRIERQMGGFRIPENLKTLPLLIRNLPSFDPFKAFELDWFGVSEPRPEDYDLTTFLAGIQLRHLVDRDGMHMTRKFVNRHTHGQSARFLKRYSDFLPTPLAKDAERVNLSDRFYFSVTNQLATVNL